MAGLSIMILVVSSLATGSTRHEVYRTSSGRTYGRVGKPRIRMKYEIHNHQNKRQKIITEMLTLYFSLNFSLYHIHWHYLLLTRMLAHRVCL